MFLFELLFRCRTQELRISFAFIHLGDNITQTRVIIRLVVMCE